MYSKFVKTVVKSPEEIYPTCLERSGMGKFSIPPTSKKVGWGKFLSHLPRWDRILAELQMTPRPGHLKTRPARSCITAALPRPVATASK